MPIKGGRGAATPVPAPAVLRTLRDEIDEAAADLHNKTDHMNGMLKKITERLTILGVPGEVPLDAEHAGETRQLVFTKLDKSWILGIRVRRENCEDWLRPLLSVSRSTRLACVGPIVYLVQILLRTAREEALAVGRVNENLASVLESLGEP